MRGKRRAATRQRLQTIELKKGIIVEETQKADFATLIARTITWLTGKDGGIQLTKDIGIVLASFLGLFLIAGLVRRTWRCSG